MLIIWFIYFICTFSLCLHSGHVLWSAIYKYKYGPKGHNNRRHKINRSNEEMMMTLAWILYEEDLFWVAKHLCWSQKTGLIWHFYKHNTSTRGMRAELFWQEKLESLTPLQRHKHDYHSLKIRFTVSEFQVFQRNSSLAHFKFAIFLYQLGWAPKYCSKMSDILAWSTSPSTAVYRTPWNNYQIIIK